MSNFEMEDHLVLCNWSPRGLAWIHEVHAKSSRTSGRSSSSTTTPDDIELPDKQDDAAFNDVYIVKGDPTSEVVLRRAKVPTAHSVVVLSDDREGKHADGKSVLTCIAIREICRGETPAEHLGRVPQPEQSPSPAEGRGRRDHLLRRAGPEAPGPLGPLPRDDAGLPGTAHGGP